MEQVKKKRDPLLGDPDTGLVTQREVCPELPPAAAGLPKVTEARVRGRGVPALRGGLPYAGDYRRGRRAPAAW